MDHLFTAYAKYLLLAAAVLLLPAGIEARLPARTDGQGMSVEYGVCAKMACALLLLLAVLFGLALAAVERASAAERLGIFALLGVPAMVVVAETSGKKVRLEGDRIVRSYFGLFSRSRALSSVVRVTHEPAWGMFRVRFSDGSTLWIPTLMRGSAQAAEQLHDRAGPMRRREKP